MIFNGNIIHSEWYLMEILYILNNIWWKYSFLRKRISPPRCVTKVSHFLPRIIWDMTYSVLKYPRGTINNLEVTKRALIWTQLRAGQKHNDAFSITLPTVFLDLSFQQQLSINNLEFKTPKKAQNITHMKGCEGLVGGVLNLF
jgi:hypothetical protein